MGSVGLNCCATEKINHKALHKVSYEEDLNPGKMIYLVIIPKNNPNYGGPKNRVLLQYLDTRKHCLFYEDKIKINVNCLPFNK